MGLMMTQTSFSVSESGRAPIYSGVAKTVPALVTAAEAVRLGGLDYEVGLEPMITASGIEVPKSRAVVRRDTGRVLGVVGDRYKVLQNDRAMEILDAVVGKDRAVFECAGTLRDGAVAFAVLKLAKQIVLPGDDVVEKRVLFYTTHDGSGMTRAKVLPYRLFCANQLTAALGAKTDGVGIRHTSQAEARLKQAERILGFSEQYFEEFANIAKIMQRTTLPTRDMAEFTTLILPSPEGKAAPKQTLEARETLMDLWETGGGQAGHAVNRGTVWGAYNAVAEYVDHERRTRTADQSMRAELKVESSWFGSGARLLQTAADMLVQKI